MITSPSWSSSTPRHARRVVSGIVHHAPELLVQFISFPRRVVHHAPELLVVVVQQPAVQRDLLGRLVLSTPRHARRVVCLVRQVVVVLLVQLVLFIVSPIAHYNFSSLITPHRDSAGAGLDKSESELAEFMKHNQLEFPDDNQASYFIHGSIAAAGEYKTWARAFGESARGTAPRCCCAHHVVAPTMLLRPPFWLALLPQPMVSIKP